MKDNRYIFNIGVFFGIFYICVTLLFPFIFYIGKIYSIDFLNEVRYSLYYYNGVSLITSSLIFYSIIGFLFFIIGYFLFSRYLFKFQTKNKVKEFISSSWTFENMYYSFWLMLIVVTLHKFYGIYTLRYDLPYFYLSVIGNEKIAYFFSFNILSFILLFIISFSYFKAKSEENIKWEKKLKYLFYFTFIIMFIMSLNLKSRYLTIEILFIVLMVYNMFNKINIIKFIISIFILLTLIIALKPLIYEYRGISGTLTFDMKASTDRIVSRVNQSHVLSQLFNYKHDVVNYNEDLATKINVMDYNNNSGVGMTMLGYFFYEYKLLGVIFGMFSVGIIYRILYELFLRKYMVFVLTYVLIFPFLINVFEQQIFQAIDKIFYYLFLAFFIHILIMKGGGIDIVKKIVNK